MRKISLLGDNSKFPSNEIKTTKYNFITFLPLSILFQFNNYSNIYFLLVAVILAIKKISPQDPTIGIIPFVFVIAVGILVEAFEEVKKFLYDKKLNNSIAKKNDFTKKNVFIDCKWRNIYVGDFIKIKKNEMISADILIIATSSTNNFCYMQTTNLDGESALKARETINIETTIDDTSDFEKIFSDSTITVENPNNNIYKCNGNLVLRNKKKYFFQIDNILLRGTMLKNTEWVIGIVLYTGKDTKIMRNIQTNKLKSSSIEEIVNTILVGVIISVFLLCIICTIVGFSFLLRNEPDYDKNDLKLDYIYYHKHDKKFPHTLEFFKLFAAFFILVNNIIPISMAITFTIGKVIQIIIIEFDSKLKDSPNDQIKVFSTRLQEDLGKIKYIFTDKTGTLTRNEMVFKGCSVCGEIFCDEDTKEKMKSEIANKNKNLIRFSLGIAINHDVLNEYDDEKKCEVYQGSNPDEVALVTMMKSIGIVFKSRVGSTITLENVNEKEELIFNVKQVFKYTSERKRSGILIETPTKELILYVKGSDDKIFSMCNDISKTKILPLTKKHLDLFAKKGLRTLCYGYKKITNEFYMKWEKEYSEIKTKAIGNESSFLPEIEKIISTMENNITLLGVSGLEDRLQDEAKEDIEKFIEAGIKMFMITGDQMMTAESIGYSSNFFQTDTEVFRITGEEKVDDKLREILDYVHKTEKDLNNMKINTNEDTKKKNYSFNGNDELINTNGNNCFMKEKNQSMAAHEAPFKNEFVTNTIDDISVIKHIINFEKVKEEESIRQSEHSDRCNLNSSNTLIDYINKGGCQPKKIERIFTQYKNQLTTLENKKETINKFTAVASLNLSKSHISKNFSFNKLNFGIVIQGSAMINCITEHNKKIFFELITKSRSIIFCRCTPIQKSQIVRFVQECTNDQELCLAIGDGGNDVNMIKKANVGVGIFGKEGHQAAYNSDYAISQFKFLKRLLFYHGRYILMRNSYFIYFFFYKGLLFCFPQIWFCFLSASSGTNFWDFVWFTMYTGLVSTMPPVVIMVFEEDIDVDKVSPSLLPDIYKEYRDSNPFNVVKFFTVFTLGIVHSIVFFVWGMYAFQYNIDSSGRVSSMWGYSNMCMLTVLVVQYLIIFLDTNKFSMWVCLAHGAQILINLIFGLVYAKNGTSELGAYTFDTLKSWNFWLILFCSIWIMMVPLYFSRYFDYLFGYTIINNIRNGNLSEEIQRKGVSRKIEDIVKCTRGLEKFKRVYKEIDCGNFKPETYADKKMKEIVEEYKGKKEKHFYHGNRFPKDTDYEHDDVKIDDLAEIL